MRLTYTLLTFCSITLCDTSRIPFDRAMGKHHPLYAHYFDRIAQNHDALSVYNTFAQMYAQNYQLLQHTAKLKIPKIIHQIWLGSEMPAEYLCLMRSWQKHHPDWEYILWTDDMIEALNLTNQDLYDTAINYGERSDIARYEILYRFGGLYADTDFECVQSFDALHKSFDLYAGIELPGMASFLSTIILSNGIIGSKPGHPILKECITALRTKKNAQDILQRTGALVFMEQFLCHANIHGTDDIALPALYLYPIDKKTKDPATIASCIQPYTYAIHHWAGSWILKERAFVPGIKIKTRQEGNVLKFRIVDERTT